MKQQANESTIDLVKDIFNDKKYCEIRKPNKDIVIILTYAPNCTVMFTYCFNSISGGYMGLQVNSFISSIRGLLKGHPDFFTDLMEHDYRKYFKWLDFQKVEPTEKEILIFGR